MNTTVGCYILLIHREMRYPTVLNRQRDTSTKQIYGKTHIKPDTVCKTGLQEGVALKAKDVGRFKEYSCVLSNDHKSRYLLRHESFTLLTYIPSTPQTTL
jgi:hypothetical protein